MHHDYSCDSSGNPDGGPNCLLLLAADREEAGLVAHNLLVTYICTGIARILIIMALLVLLLTRHDSRWCTVILDRIMFTYAEFCNQ